MRIGNYSFDDEICNEANEMRMTEEDFAKYSVLSNLSEKYYEKTFKKTKKEMLEFLKCELQINSRKHMRVG